MSVFDLFIWCKFMVFDFVDIVFDSWFDIGYYGIDDDIVFGDVLVSDMVVWSYFCLIKWYMFVYNVIEIWINKLG